MLVWDSKNIVDNKWIWINKGHTEISMTLPTNFNNKWKQSCLDVFLGRDAADRSHRSAEVKAPIRVVWRFIGSLHPKDIQRTWMGNQCVKWHSQIKMPSNLASLKRAQTVSAGPGQVNPWLPGQVNPWLFQLFLIWLNILWKNEQEGCR